MDTLTIEQHKKLEAARGHISEALRRLDAADELAQEVGHDFLHGALMTNWKTVEATYDGLEHYLETVELKNLEPTREQLLKMQWDTREVDAGLSYLPGEYGWRVASAVYRRDYDIERAQIEQSGRLDDEEAIDQETLNTVLYGYNQLIADGGAHIIPATREVNA